MTESKMTKHPSKLGAVTIFSSHAPVAPCQRMVLEARLQVPICGARLEDAGGAVAGNAWRPATSSTARTCRRATARLARTGQRRPPRRAVLLATYASEDR